MRLFLTLAPFEVMDKEPGILGFWVAALVLGGIGYVLARRRWWWAVPILALLALGFVGTWGEWTDPYVGPAIANEAGRFYPYHLSASTVFAAGLTLFGMTRPRREAQRIAAANVRGRTSL